MSVKVPFVPAEDLVSSNDNRKPTDQDFMMALAVMKDQGRLAPNAPQPLFMQQQIDSPAKDAFNGSASGRTS